MRINHNIASLDTYSKLEANRLATNKALERLSSGSKINKPADDSAGLAISEKFRAQIKDTQQVGQTTGAINKVSAYGDSISLSNAGIIRSRSEGGIALRDSIKAATQQASKDSQQAFKDSQQAFKDAQQMTTQIGQDLVQHIQENLDNFNLKSMTDIKKSVLNQASTAMLAQANTTPQAALQLLR